jgi:hypothetical protein
MGAQARRRTASCAREDGRHAGGGACARYSEVPPRSAAVVPPPDEQVVVVGPDHRLDLELHELVAPGRLLPTRKLDGTPGGLELCAASWPSLGSPRGSRGLGGSRPDSIAKMLTAFAAASGSLTDWSQRSPAGSWCRGSRGFSAELAVRWFPWDELNREARSPRSHICPRSARSGAGRRWLGALPGRSPR